MRAVSCTPSGSGEPSHLSAVVLLAALVLVAQLCGCTRAPAPGDLTKGAKDLAAVKSLGLELYPAATIVMANDDPKAGIDAVALTTAEPLDKVLQFYADKYGAKSGKATAVPGAKGTATLAWTEGQTQFTVTIGRKPGSVVTGIALLRKTVK